MSEKQAIHTEKWLLKQVEIKETREKDFEREEEDNYLLKSHIYDCYREQYCRE